MNTCDCAAGILRRVFLMLLFLLAFFGRILCEGSRMAQIPIEKIRNIALTGHGGCGKTILAEALLYAAGATTRMGKIEDGNTVSDYHSEEIKRGFSIFTSLIPFSTEEHQITVLDTPGYQDFVGEMLAGLSVVDSTIIVVNGQAGVETQTEKAWAVCEDFKLPKLIFISQLEKEGADYFRVLDELRKRFKSSIAPFVIPIGEQQNFSGVVDILTGKAFYVEGKNAREDKVPADMADRVEEMRMNLIEAIVENDDELMEMFLADEEIPEERLIATMRSATLSGALVPCFAGAAEKLIGVHPLLAGIRELLPSPIHKEKIVGTKPGGAGEEVRRSDSGEPFSARVFKIEESAMGNLTFFRVYSGCLKPGDQFSNPQSRSMEKVSTLLRMIGKNREDVNDAFAGDILATVKLKETRRGDTICDKDHPIVLPGVEYPHPLAFEAIEVESKSDLEKVSAGLNNYSQVDPTLFFEQDPETRELVLKGMGELQLDVYRSLVCEKYKVSFGFREPKIPYRETIRAVASAQGKHKKQTGGRGQYGDVWLELTPKERGEGFEFNNAIVGGVVPGKFIPAVEKGVVETMMTGPLAGCQVVDLQVKLYDGSYHNVDSSEMAFKTAASIGFKSAFENARPVLLEPVFAVQITVPEAFMGDVMGDINSRRGRLQGMDSPAPGVQVIKAHVPLAELYKYVNTLRSMTQGRGNFEMVFSHYEEVPEEIASKIIEAYRKEREEG